MYVVFLAVELIQGASEFLADVPHDGFAVFEDGLRERSTPIFCHEHQMRMTIPNRMPSLTYLTIVLHDTKYNERCLEVN